MTDYTKNEMVENIETKLDEQRKAMGERKQSKVGIRSLRQKFEDEAKFWGDQFIGQMQKAQN